MSTLHYVNAQGDYIGGFGDGAIPPQGSVEVPEPPHAEAKWVNGAWSFDAAAEARKRMSLSFIQLVVGVITEGWITEAQGEAWLSGDLPQQVTDLIATLPAGERFIARARARRPSIVERNSPLVVLLAASQGKSDAQMDAFFTTYAGV